MVLSSDNGKIWHDWPHPKHRQYQVICFFVFCSFLDLYMIGKTQDEPLIPYPNVLDHKILQLIVLWHETAGGPS